MIKDRTGLTLGKCYVLGYVGLVGDKRMWCGVCICGNLFLIDGARIRKHISKSCGCDREENIRKSITKMAEIKKDLPGKYDHKLQEVRLCNISSVLFEKHKWRVGKYGNHFYLHRSESLGAGENKTILFHRELLDFPNKLVDHINGNTLDNRLENLREATHSENNRNRHVITGASGVKGVYWNKERGLWQAQASYNNRHHFIGRFSELEDAKNAYDEYIKTNMDCFTTTNDALKPINYVSVDLKEFLPKGE